MSDKTHKTKGIVLRTVKYGESSVIVSIYTEIFGQQSYLVNGVRTSGKKGSAKANLFQPGVILDLVVYHNELKQLQRLKEFRWGFLYKHILQDVIKNTVVLFMVELLSKCLKQPEENPDLFYFMEDALLHLDEADDKTVAGYPLFFLIQLTYFLGIPPQVATGAQAQEAQLFFDLKEGFFTTEIPDHHHYIQQPHTSALISLLQVRQPKELPEVPLTGENKRKLMVAMEEYYQLHITDFGTLRTVPILREILR
ncbi:DNA repair protein RecO [Terrimonas rubra]|uniref:DNA repair protein RecO n=1 Tax=Terrimonas rubra TaxID=1035890 RepID=A0ABW6A113_9BACT